jgi:hypothetical protein
MYSNKLEFVPLKLDEIFVVLVQQLFQVMTKQHIFVVHHEKIAIDLFLVN